MGNYRLIATSAFGIEGIVKDEIKRLGFTNIVVENGRILFDADAAGIVRANLWLRCADRVHILVGKFRAKTFVELFDKTKKLDWDRYIPIDGEFPVSAKSVKSKLFSVSDIQSITKKSIVENLKDKYKIDWFEETGSKFHITAAILNDEVSLTIDTSGLGLHKRGYREDGNIAPLKETLAAALIKASRWHAKIPLIDPMCGTGTIAIEAALMGRNIAPGLNRKFDFESWDFIPSEVIKEERVKAYSQIDYEKQLNISAFDVDRRVINIAKLNAEKAGVEDDIVFKVQDAKDINTKDKYGYIISNPPYGERLGTEEEIFDLYSMMGTSYKRLETWSKYIFTSNEEFERFFGKKSDKNRKLYNGRLKCYLYQYIGEKPPKIK
ncbi:THUMP domain-containing class I SAM-dependent RNA methyltransferase [Helicovermis profundi]|uniref:Class I SAM-dependent RNA methyltransferase n=1 Tax=Helicovermis profundi TaxID=3065157 RepID=A0AAU9EHT9_9FIRM|nr:class I SAM-dependent RNA methyltransferase [Clostridia bacterium S502]